MGGRGHVGGHPASGEGGRRDRAARGHRPQPGLRPAQPSLGCDTGLSADTVAVISRRSVLGWSVTWTTQTPAHPTSSRAAPCPPSPPQPPSRGLELMCARPRPQPASPHLTAPPPPPAQEWLPVSAPGFQRPRGSSWHRNPSVREPSGRVRGDHPVLMFCFIRNRSLGQAQAPRILKTLNQVSHGPLNAT